MKMTYHMKKKHFLKIYQKKTYCPNIDSSTSSDGRNFHKKDNRKKHFRNQKYRKMSANAHALFFHVKK